MTCLLMVVTWALLTPCPALRRSYKLLRSGWRPPRCPQGTCPTLRRLRAASASVAPAQGSRNPYVAAVEVMVRWLHRYPFFPAFKVGTILGQGRGRAGSSITAHELHHMAFGLGGIRTRFMPNKGRWYMHSGDAG